MQDKHLTALDIALSDDALIALDELAVLGAPPDDSAAGTQALQQQLTLDEKRREEQDGNADDGAATAENSTAPLQQPPALQLAALGGDLNNFIANDSNAQVLTKPPEGGDSGNAAPWYSQPLIWTGLGVLGIAALDASDSDSSGGSSGNRSPFFRDPTQELSVDEDQPLQINAQAKDRDRDELTYTVFSQPDNGTITEDDEPGLYIYTPDAEFSGEDTFTIRVRDGNGGLATQTITVTVNAVNDTPAAEATQYLSGDVNQILQISVGATDAEGDTLTYSFTDAGNGVVTRGDSPGVFIYTPNDGFSGEDSFTITISDGNSEFTQTVNLRMGLPNAAPEADATQSIETVEDSEVSFTVDALDIDGDNLSFSASDPANGTVEEDENNPGRFVYTPDADYNGQDSFVITITDGNGGSTTQTVTVDITPADDTYELTVEDAEAIEGDDGVSSMVFTLKLDRAPFDEDVTVSITAVDGSATAGDDYNLLTDSVTFVAGQDTVTVEVDIIGDVSFGADESFSLNFSGEKLDDDVTATGTIVNDDPDPNRPIYTLTADNAEIVELNQSTNKITFEITLDKVTEEDLVIEVFTADGTATAGSDYQALNSTVTIPAGQSSATVEVTVGGDNTFEADETFTVTFRSEQLTDTVSVIGTIINNDLDPSIPDPVMTLQAGSDTGISQTDNITGDDTPTFTITGEPGGTVLIARNGSFVGEATETSAGVYEFQSSELSDGNYQFNAVLRLPGISQTLSSDALVVRVDTTAPTVVSLAADENDDSVTITFNEILGDYDSGSIELYIDGILASVSTSSTTSNGTGITFQLQNDVQAGSVFDIALADSAVIDRAGNASAALLLGDDPTGIVI